MINPNTFNQTISVLAIATQAGIVLFILANLIFRKNNFVQQLNILVAKYWLWLILLISGAGMALSLIYSNIIHYPPCILCWYQRIFLYPQFIIAAIALAKKYGKEALDYCLGLTVIGAIIAAYHYFGQMSYNEFLPCAEAADSCVKTPFIEFGYITIPMMALTAFAAILVVIGTRKYLAK